MSIEANLITGRTFTQGATMEEGKGTKAYTKAAAVCEMDPEDMMKIGVKDGDTVKVTSEYGEVVLWARRSSQYPHEGTVFIPLGPWANALLAPGTDSTGMPSFKDVPVTVEKVEDGKVLEAFELVRSIYGGGN
ncbi:MAG: molybdopterin dinucleotide-binding protein [Euryarchaeota archaeon]|nr:molybdopterin dinucleotide-binding protein [Euryarchaeota archaeon]